MKKFIAIFMGTMLLGAFLTACSGGSASASTDSASASGTYSTTLADVQEKGCLLYTSEPFMGVGVDGCAR